MRTKLTQAFVEKVAAAPGAERTLYWDSSMAGFGLVVTSGGHKSFVYQYRANRRSRRMTFKFDLGLDKARKQARKASGRVADGKDPLGERRHNEEEVKNTVRAVCEEYLAREGRKIRTIDERRSVLSRLVYPRLGLRQIDSIRRTEIVRLLDRIEDENGAAMADHTLAYLRRVLNWHAARSDDFKSPIVRGMARTKPKERPRDRILTDDELRSIWKAADAPGSVFGGFIQFVLLTASRRGEAACMARSELGGPSEVDWSIPAARYKTKADFLIPLSSAALRALARVPRIGKCEFVFTTDGKRPISGFSKWKRDFDEACGVQGWTLNDLRRTARSLMSRAGVLSDHAERALGHVLPGVRGVYDRHAYYDEKKRAFEALAAQIDHIINPQDNVVSIGRGAA